MKLVGIISILIGIILITGCIGPAPEELSPQEKARQIADKTEAGQFSQKLATSMNKMFGCMKEVIETLPIEQQIIGTPLEMIGCELKLEKKVSEIRGEMPMYGSYFVIYSIVSQNCPTNLSYSIGIADVAVSLTTGETTIDWVVSPTQINPIIESIYSMQECNITIAPMFVALLKELTPGLKTITPWPLPQKSIAVVSCAYENNITKLTISNNGIPTIPPTEFIVIDADTRTQLPGNTILNLTDYLEGSSMIGINVINESGNVNLTASKQYFLRAPGIPDAPFIC